MYSYCDIMKLDVDGKPTGECFHLGIHVRMHAQMDGQVKSRMQPIWQPTGWTAQA